ncbi:SxtJ family membrane protein [Pelagibacteraceae bacterium]|nr:SxtJ family membrane protein [Pelagibacteraceae bacterium]
MKKKKNTNRSFGILFFIVFSIISIWPILSGNELRLWSFIVAIIFLIMGITKSRFLTPFNIAWIKFGELLGVIISPLIMSLVYFLVVLPIGILMRVLGKDLLSLKFNKNIETYWNKKELKTNFNKQF